MALDPASDANRSLPAPARFTAPREGSVVQPPRILSGEMSALGAWGPIVQWR